MTKKNLLYSNESIKDKCFKYTSRMIRFFLKNLLYSEKYKR